MGDLTLVAIPPGWEKVAELAFRYGRFDIIIDLCEMDLDLAEEIYLENYRQPIRDVEGLGPCWVDPLDGDLYQCGLEAVRCGRVRSMRSTASVHRCPGVPSMILHTATRSPPGSFVPTWNGSRIWGRPGHGEGGWSVWPGADVDQALSRVTIRTLVDAEPALSQAGADAGAALEGGPLAGPGLQLGGDLIVNRGSRDPRRLLAGLQEDELHLLPVALDGDGFHGLLLVQRKGNFPFLPFLVRVDEAGAIRHLPDVLGAGLAVEVLRVVTPILQPPGQGGSMPRLVDGVAIGLASSRKPAPAIVGGHAPMMER